MTHILAIDQGTTSSRAILFDAAMVPAHVAQREFTQHYPASGWVEHDVAEIWDSVQATCEEVLARSDGVAAIGITNQRETTIVWDKDSGKPVHNALVWQDRRTTDRVEEIQEAGKVE